MDLTRSLSDVVALLAGLVAVLAPFFWAGDVNAANLPLLILGALLVVSALWAILGAGGAGSWVTAAFGALLFVSPWAFNFDGHSSAAWTAWIAGAVTVVVGLLTTLQARTAAPTRA
ncbi:SPW repeat protein [Planotetraspora sp. A-T 1434]|uniref:SPW repeat protein n=1 Tax=Planotetraspora sp. A-T 1434 TaxID=2979219 RepID=UPI0021BE21A4|nr:SPW repeat protein [Planotetraspora sp. A-T 1434]MCT9930827.1 SPW repeat protein [Planotetraspora sp. A-T 1434]